MSRSLDAASLAVALATALVACNGIFGIDAGHAPDDAGADAASRDAGGPDAAGDGGAPDATEAGGAHDASTDGGLADTGVACVPVSPAPEAGPQDPAGCIFTDASDTCNVQGTPPGWVPPWTPPALSRAACTAAEIETYVVDCFYSGNCAPFAAASPDCMKCIETPEASAAHGAVVVPARDVFKWPNVAGCIALLEPCNEPCARMTRELQGCLDTACATSCQALGNGAYAQCQARAEGFGCMCEPIRTASRSCQRQIFNSTGPARLCGSLGAPPEDSVRLVARALCGGK